MLLQQQPNNTTFHKHCPMHCSHCLAIQGCRKRRIAADRTTAWRTWLGSFLLSGSQLSADSQSYSVNFSMQLYYVHPTAHSTSTALGFGERSCWRKDAALSLTRPQSTKRHCLAARIVSQTSTANSCCTHPPVPCHTYTSHKRLKQLRALVAP